MLQPLFDKVLAASIPAPNGVGITPPFWLFKLTVTPPRLIEFQFSSKSNNILFSEVWDNLLNDKSIYFIL